MAMATEMLSRKIVFQLALRIYLPSLSRDMAADVTTVGRQEPYRASGPTPWAGEALAMI